MHVCACMFIHAGTMYVHSCLCNGAHLGAIFHVHVCICTCVICENFCMHRVCVLVCMFMHQCFVVRVRINVYAPVCVCTKFECVRTC